MAQGKRPKTYHFHKEWEEDYFFVEFKGKPICLICKESVALSKKCNVERHYTSRHKGKYDQDFPPKTALRSAQLQTLKKEYGEQKATFTRPVTKAQAATVASYRVSHVVAKHKKSFTDGEFVKEAFTVAAESLFAGFENKREIMNAIKDMQLSRSTVTRRCEDMSEDLHSQLKKDVNSCECFSLQFDESTDMVDVAQLCIFIRMVFDDMTAKEELLTILPLKGTTRGEDIFHAFMEFVKESQLPLHKLVSITTDGAPAMVGRNNGFIGLCKKSDDFPDFHNYHCIIHQQALCGKVLNMKEVMDIAMKIVCSVRARSLQRRLFRAHMEETESEHTDLLLHTDVRWLSRGKFLDRFSELLPEIKEFLKLGKHVEYTQLEDKQWLLDLAFLTDFTGTLNELNLELQGKDKCVINMISSVNGFKSKIEMWAKRLQRSDLRNFPHMQAEVQRQGRDTATFDCTRYAAQVESIVSEFDKRFTDFSAIEPVASYMCFPFGNVDVDDITPRVASLCNLDSSSVEDEIITLQNDIEIKSRATKQGTKGEFWGLLMPEKYPNLRKCAMKITALFGSTYLCESAFSHMKFIKSKYRATMTDEHLEACLKLATSSYNPDFEKLASYSQLQVSH